MTKRPPAVIMMGKRFITDIRKTPPQHIMRRCLKIFEILGIVQLF